MGRDSQGDQGGKFRKEGSKLTDSGVNTTFVCVNRQKPGEGRVLIKDRNLFESQMR